MTPTSSCRYCGNSVCRLCGHVVFLDLRSLPIKKKDDKAKTAEGYQEHPPERGAPSAAYLQCQLEVNFAHTRRQFVERDVSNVGVVVMKLFALAHSRPPPARVAEFHIEGPGNVGSDGLVGSGTLERQRRGHFLSERTYLGAPQDRQVSTRCIDCLRSVLLEFTRLATSRLQRWQ